MYLGFEQLHQKSRDGEGLRKLTPYAAHPPIAQLARLGMSLEVVMLAVLPDVRIEAGWQDGQGSLSVVITEPQTTFASSNPLLPL